MTKKFKTLGAEVKFEISENSKKMNAVQISNTMNKVGDVSVQSNIIGRKVI